MNNFIFHHRFSPLTDYLLYNPSAVLGQSHFLLNRQK